MQEDNEPMTATEVKIRHLLLNMQLESSRIIEGLTLRLELCEKVFIKIMQLDVRLHTVEFNSGIPTTPSSAEKIMDFEMRIKRLESYLIKGESNE